MTEPERVYRHRWTALVVARLRGWTYPRGSIFRDFVVLPVGADPKLTLRGLSGA